MKKIWIVIGAVIFTVLVAAGSFWGGMAYSARRAEQVRANFINARGGPNTGQMPGSGQGFPGEVPPGAQAPGMFGGRGVIGQVKSVNGNVVTLSTAQDVTTVNLSESTQVQKTVSGTLDDLLPGVRVMVTGEKNQDGKIAASQITILRGGAPAAGAPAAGTEP